MISTLPSTEARVSAIVEVPRFGFVKRNTQGRIDMLSPLPCPFNYGSVPGTTAGDGDPVDAVILGRRRDAGVRLDLPIRAAVDFIDAGQEDPKLILSEAPLTAFERWQVDAFFRVYAVIKRLVNAARGKGGPTAFRGYLAPDAFEAPDGSADRA